MWHLMQKRSLRFAIFKWIAVCMQLISCSNRLGIRSNGSSYLLKKNGQPFERLQLSMQKKNCRLFEWLGLSVQKKLSAVWVAWAVCAKKLSAVWVAWAVCAKKIVSCLSGSGCLCKKNCQLFEWLGLSVQKKLSAVWMARAVCAKKNVFCWNSSGYPLKKTVSHSNSLGYLFEKNWQLFKS